MKTSRRKLLQGVALGFLSTSNFAQADPRDPEVERERKRRLRFLSPPDGLPAFGASPSPLAEPFKDPLFVPPIAEPLIDMSSSEWRAKSDAEWWSAFVSKFEATANELRKAGIDIGTAPLPDAHQRFFEYRPQKFYVLREREFKWKFHSGYGQDSWNWGFECISLTSKGLPKYTRGFSDEGQGSSPGPTFHAKYGEPILVRRINALPEVGNVSGGANLKFALPSTTTHLHNAHTASESDGYPGDWINPGEYWDHHYANFPSGHDDSEKLATLWYHDHRMDFTAANVYAGLDGFYFLFDDDDANNESIGWNLPSGKYDVPMILHDLAFSADDEGVPQLAFDGFMTDGIVGDRYTVNRTVQPNFAVEPRKYRLRLLNGGPSRFYELGLWDKSKKLDDYPFIVLTGDGNFQPNPLLANSIYIGVAQRVDVIIDFSQFSEGQNVYLVNELLQTNGKGPAEVRLKLEGQDAASFLNKNSVLRFTVGAKKGLDNSAFPLFFRDFPKVDLTEVARERLWVFDYEGGLWTVNGHIFDPNRVDAGIEQDTAEIWTFRNNGNGWHHPIHSHFTEFIVLEINGEPEYQARVQTDQVARDAAFARVFNSPEQLSAQFGKLFKGETEQVPGEKRIEPEAIEAYAALSPDVQQMIREGKFEQIRIHSYQIYRQWADLFPKLGLGNIKVDRFMGGPRRDVALLLPNWEVKVFMRWKDFLGRHVMHCHNVVHEDHAMMIRWEIVPRGRGFDTPKQAPEVAQLGKKFDADILHRVEPTPAKASVGENE